MRAAGDPRDAAVSVSLAALALTLLEASGLRERGIPLGAVALLHLAATFTAAAALALAVAALLAGLGRRFSPRLPALFFVLAALLPIHFAVRSLFSGGGVSELRGVGFLRAGFAGALLLAVAAAGTLLPRLAAARGWRAAALAAAAAGGGAAAAWLDTHVQVGLYPAAHALLAAALLSAALFLGALARRALRGRLPPLRSVAAAWVVLAAVWSAAAWNADGMVHLATYSDGLLPKLREAAVAVAASRRVLRARPPEPGIALVPGEFRLAPTRDPELDALRGRLRNVVMVLVDGLRDDHVGALHDGRSLTPTFDELARQSIRFDNAYAGSDRTGRSMPVLMTSMPLPVVERAAELDVPLETWIDVLRERGFATFANGNCDYVTRKHPQIPVSAAFGAEQVGSHDESLLVPEVLRFVAAHPRRPFAVYTHWMDVHVPSATKDFAAVYAAAVRRVDGRLEELLAGLAALGRLEDTLVVLTADHGYSLGEDFRFLGHQCCGERQVRVPLLLRLPGSSHAGRRLAPNVGAVDVAATILDALAPDAGALVGGRSLLGLLYDPDDPRRADRHAVFASSSAVRMARRGDFKLQWSLVRDTELVFDVVRDPGERRPISDGALRRELGAALRDEIDRETRLTATLASRRHPELAGDVLAGLLRPDLRAEAVRPLLRDFWARPSPTRRFVLETIQVRGLAGLQGDLDALDRERDEDDDQILAVVRAFAGSPRACEELAARAATLGVDAKLWLAETFPALPPDCRERLSGPLFAELRRAHEAGADPDAPEGRFLALGACALPAHLGAETPRELKELIRDLFNATARRPKRYTIPLMKGRPFDPRGFLRVLEATATADDLDVLADLERNEFSTRTIVATCLRIDTPASHALLLEVLAGPLDTEMATEALKALGEGGDETLRRKASALLAARFPGLEAGF